ncbi:MAG: radical SAM protein [Elusimicrobia bacterium]|nr:radical SAM protein [Elusimicrobiota bacterium]
MKLSHIAHIGLGTLAAHISNRRVPLNLMFAATDRCVASCAYCHIPGRNKQELATADVLKLIDQAAAAGCRRFGIWGGEPLVRDDMEDIAGYAKQKGLFVTMDSNGHLLPGKISILRSLDHLMLSLDGPEAMHDLNRGPGSFRKVMAGIEAAAGRVPLWTITVLTKHNLDCLDFILETARRCGFLATFQLLHHNDAMGRNQAALLPQAADTRSFIARLIAEKKRGAPIASSVPYLEHLLRWPDFAVPMRSGPVEGAMRCWAGQLYCNVDTDGSVYPCSLLVDQMPSRNFLDGGLRRAFEFAGGQELCSSCIASCFSEYNLLFSLHPPTVLAWLSAMRRTRRATEAGPQP